MNSSSRILVAFVCFAAFTMNAAAQESKPKKIEKVEIFLLEKKPISGVTKPDGLQLSESRRGPLSYVHKKPIFQFTKEKVVACTQTKVGFGDLPGHGWLVTIKLNRKAKAELINAMMKANARGIGWFIITLNGEKQPGEYTTGYLATGFTEIGIAYYRSKKEAEALCNVLLSK